MISVPRPPLARDPAFERDLSVLAIPGLLIGHRLISAGDEDALLPGELASMGAAAAADRKRASGAARLVARQLLEQLGHADVAIPRGASGEPVWPSGIVGSLAHDDRVAVAAVARRADFSAVGIDAEPAGPLPPGMWELVATPLERQQVAHGSLEARLLFAAKEAVYKAAYPLDRLFLEFHDIEVDLAARSAVTRTGRTLALRYRMSSHIVVVALAGASVEDHV